MFAVLFNIHLEKLFTKVVNFAGVPSFPSSAVMGLV
jgi:hypothetical protein